jgi:hypothetical protein
MKIRVIEHDIKLGKSLKVILAVLAIGVLLNAFFPIMSTKSAFTELSVNETLNLKVRHSE